MKEKILHVITGLNNGGAEGVLTRLCLNSHAFEHIVISLTDEGKYGPQLKAGGIKVYSLDMAPARPSLRKLYQLIRVIKNEKPKVVQTWMYHSDLFGGIAAKIAGVENVFWGIRHSTLDKNNSKRLTRVIAKICSVLSYVIPRKIICCAEKAREVHSKLGYQKEKLFVIPNGFDTDKFSPDVTGRETIRKALGIPLSMPLIGMVGRFAEQKDYKSLIDALAILKKSFSNFRCILVGTNVDNANPALVEWLELAGLEDHIVLAGPRTDIAQIMNAIDIHVLSSNGGEGFPNVVAEAMACGTPCVSTDVGDAKRIIGDTGKVCCIGHPGELSNSILFLVNEFINEKSKWHARQDYCRNTIREKYTIDVFVSSFESCWDL